MLGIGAMTKAELKVLERIFETEVRGLLPFQFGRRKDPAIALRLADAGMIHRMRNTIPSRLGAITIDGWELTHAGRITYCSTCEDKPDTEP